MANTPLNRRTFPMRISALTYFPTFLRWMRHLSERLGTQNTLDLWQRTFNGYKDTALLQILSAGWQVTPVDESDDPQQRLQTLTAEYFPHSSAEISAARASEIIESTPPIAQIRRLFDWNSVEKEITAREALFLRFDSLACLAEALMDAFGKQGELIVYDLMLQTRLAASATQGSVQEFIEDFTSAPTAPSLFTAGLEMQVIYKTPAKAVVHVHECAWANYFRQHHPRVGYLMACSSDEAAYKTFNPQLRLCRTQTLMESGALCDFTVYAAESLGANKE